MNTLRFTSLAIAVASSVACSKEGVAPVANNVDATDIVFLTQSEPQLAHMDALFVGRVVIDAAKCVRMDDADRATVIWPPGFTVSGANGALDTFDGDGRLIGRLGDSFRIGGGQVPTLHPQLHISYVDRARAHESCPGLYWIVSEVQQR